MKTRRQLKIVAGIIAVICMLAPFSAKAEWDASDAQYIGDKFKTFLRSTIQKAEVKDSTYIIGVPLGELRSRCSSLEIHGLSTWDEGSSVCWEFIKQAIPLTPFNLVEGVNRSAIVKVDYEPFSDPGPSVFFYFGEDAEK